jgi:hypothetical protein
MSFLDRLLRGTPPSSAEEVDRITLRKLQGMGADLTKPRDVLHFLEFPAEISAREAADELERAGWTTTITAPSETEWVWSLRAQGMRVVDATTVSPVRAWFEALAARHGGEYEGWEVSRRP